MKKPPRLIPEARKAPRMFSVQALAGIVALQGLWMASPELQAAVPVAVAQGITIVLALLGIVGRVVTQNLK